MSRKKYKQPEPDGERYRFKPVRNFLSMVELKELWKMYEADCSLQTICLYMRISKEYALECIQAAKWLYGGGLVDFRKKRREMALNGFFKWAKPPEEREIFKIPADAKPKFKRPAAEYTNTTPFGVAKKYQTINS